MGLLSSRWQTWMQRMSKTGGPFFSEFANSFAGLFFLCVVVSLKPACTGSGPADDSGDLKEVQSNDGGNRSNGDLGVPSDFADVSNRTQDVIVEVTGRDTGPEAGPDSFSVEVEPGDLDADIGGPGLQLPEEWGRRRLLGRRCAVRAGKVYCWGNGAWGEVGAGNFGMERYPVEVVGISDAIEVASGTYFHCALQSDGAVFCWGRNDGFQLGSEVPEASPSPLEVPGLPALQRICAALDYACGLDNSGGTWCWGAGQALAPVGANEEGSPPFIVFEVPLADQIDCGTLSACVRTPDGVLWCWGGNEYGQTAPGNSSHLVGPTSLDLLGKVERFRVEGLTGYAWTSSGALLCWGRDLWNKSDVPLLPQTLPQLQGSVDIAESCSLSHDGVFGCRGPVNGEPPGWGIVPVELGAPVLAASGMNAVLVPPDVLLARGGMTGAGDFEVGWHAIEVPLDEPAIAMAVGGESLVVSLNNGLVLRWGREFFGNKEAYPAPPELGVVEADLFPAKVASICGHIEEGTGYGCLLTDSGEVWCAGENNNGELGNGTSLPDPTLTKVLLDGPAHGLSCGRASGCALLGGKKIACWGSNDQMFVLPGAPTGNQLLPVVWDLPVAASRIDVTGEIACALGEDGGLWCWGAAFPLEDVEDMPAGQPFEPYLMPIPSAVVDFDIGSFFHSCILAADKQLYCYGHNGFGQIEPVPAEPSTAYFNYFHHVQHTAGLEPTLVRVGLGQTCIALQGGGVRCWGKPKNGQLGTGGPNATISAVELMAGGQVQGLMEQVVDLSISSEHSCALTISGKVYCWGINYVSQCGWPAIFEDFTPVAWEDVD